MQFEFSIGGHFGSGFHLEWKDDSLLINIFSHSEIIFEEERTRAMEEKHVIPLNGSAEWKKFIGYLSTREWKGFYDAYVCDGTQWSILFKLNGKEIDAGGSEKYPSGFFKMLKLLNAVTLPYDIEIG